MRPTIRDIAKVAGVSPSAVSFALNGRPGVSEETRARIVRVAEEMNWRPNAVARALSESTTRTVGITIMRQGEGVVGEAMYLRLISGINRGLKESGHSLQLRIVSTLKEEVDVYREWWGSRGVDGVFVLHPRENDIRLEALQQMGLPSVVVGADREAPRCSAISIDEGLLMQQVVRHLSERGYRSLAFVCGDENNQQSLSRAGAFEECARKHGIEKVFSFTSDYSEDAGKVITRRLLRSMPMPVGVVYENVALAIGGRLAAAEEGLSVPGDMGIISWEESSVCRVTDPPMSAVARSPEVLGEEAAKTMIRLLREDEAEVNSVRVGHLQVRASSMRK